MPVQRRIFVSLPSDHCLPDNLNELKWAIVDRIASLGYVPEIFTNPRPMPGLAAGKAWSARDAEDIARRCSGAAIIGMPRWTVMRNGEPVRLPTEYNHYEGALARTLGLPTLVLVQSDLMRRVVFDPSFGNYLGVFRPDHDAQWLDSQEFQVAFQHWKVQLDQRHDIFLGYCSKSRETAMRIKRSLNLLGANVLDWRKFTPGRSVLQQIEDAAGRCTGGVFLFTKDDDLAATEGASVAVPRDNVVFEAGYFVALKGKRSVLIVCEEGAKMPDDLGGDIYAPLPDKTNVSSIRETLRQFLNSF